jgi:hypothetical protein
MASAEPSTTRSAAAVITSRAWAAAIAAGENQRRQRGKRDANGEPAVGGVRFRAAGRQEGDERQQRDDQHVLEQQDGDDLLAAGGRRLAALFQHLHHDGGRGEHETGGADEGDERRKAEGRCGKRQQQRRNRDLRRAEPEYGAPQTPEPRGLHFQPDDEKEHDNAELCDVQDCLRVGEQPEPEGADDEAGGEIAQHRAEPDALEDRHRDHAGRKQRHYLDEIIACSLGRHRRLSC